MASWTAVINQSHFYWSHQGLKVVHIVPKSCWNEGKFLSAQWSDK